MLRGRNLKMNLKEKLLNSTASFTWSFGQSFFVETPYGNFIWKDPDYGGDNTFTQFLGNYKDWIKFESIHFGRDKGKHLVKNYVPHNFYIVGTIDLLLKELKEL
jgi:hypothetical protein